MKSLLADSPAIGRSRRCVPQAAGGPSARSGSPFKPRLGRSFARAARGAAPVAAALAVSVPRQDVVAPAPTVLTGGGLVRDGDLSLRLYLREIGETALLTIPEEGMLAKLMDVELHASKFPEGSGEVQVRAEMMGRVATGCMYAFNVTGGGVPVANGRLMVAFGRTVS